MRVVVLMRGGSGTGAYEAGKEKVKLDSTALIQ